MTWELHLAACRSLKDKRHVLKSLKDRLHNRFNVSAAPLKKSSIALSGSGACSAIVTNSCR